MAANKAVREWKVGHKREYDDFKQQVASIGKGDLSLMERMIGLLDDCMPQDARNFYGYIYKYIGDPDSVKNDQTAFSQYDQLAAECIFNHALISDINRILFLSGIFSRPDKPTVVTDTLHSFFMELMVLLGVRSEKIVDDADDYFSHNIIEQSISE